jgi:hypothetical protein
LRKSSAFSDSYLLAFLVHYFVPNYGWHVHQLENLMQLIYPFHF